ncbi:MAG TPA: diguanylate cyclase [Gammaproteobacteria bacterium]|nr:diguanylate cyclase [Gammaproteobacteria bacterium]
MQPALNPEQASALVEHCPVPLLVLDERGEVRGFNRSFSALVGRQLAAGLVGHSHATLADHPLRGLTGTPCRVQWTDRQGVEHHLDVSRIELTGPQRLEVRFFHDITRQVQLERACDELNDRLRQQTLTDEVTGLLNQRGLMLALEPQVARSRRYNSPMSVILMDVGSDRVGHRQLRQRVAQLLKDQLRWADLIGAGAQQEFILVLPETSGEAAARLAAKLHARVAELGEAAFDDGSIHAVSGITAWRKSDNAASLLKRAAAELARARAGRTTDAAAV